VIIFSFAVERTSNKKAQALRAKQKSAGFRINMNCMVVSKFVKCLCIFCRRLIVFHLPSSQRQMKENVFSALFASLR
jgi:hypothetical protein